MGALRGAKLERIEPMALFHCRVPGTAFLVVAASLAVLSGCVSKPEPQQMARTTLETAPADLQLLCADAASSTRSDGANVLPVSSRRHDSQTFQVDLEAAGERMSCLVDSEGNIISVQPA